MVVYKWLAEDLGKNPLLNTIAESGSFHQFKKTPLTHCTHFFIKQELLLKGDLLWMVLNIEFQGNPLLVARFLSF